MKSANIFRKQLSGFVKYRQKRFLSITPSFQQDSQLVTQTKASSLLNTNKEAFTLRDDLKKAKRVVVKMGSAVLTRSDEGGIALGRLASIVEQVAEMHADGREVMLVTSGAVAFGRQRLRRELLMNKSVRETIRGFKKDDEKMSAKKQAVDPRACAAAGQSGLMSLYESMFSQYGIATAQVLISHRDLDKEHQRFLRSTLDNLLALSIIPIINTNDAVIPLNDPTVDSNEVISITDNDSLAARLAVQTNTDLLILMSNVDGLLTAPPGSDKSELIHTYSMSDSTRSIEYGEKSSVGLGGMDSKVEAASWSLKHGTNVVICNGCSNEGPVILDIINGRNIGTFFTQAPVTDSSLSVSQAKDAKLGSLQLQLLTPAQRKDILHHLADQLVEKESEILTANQLDIVEAKKTGNLQQSLFDRLILSPGRLHDLADGVRQVADKSSSLIGQVLARRQLAVGLVAEQLSVPIGVLLIIFESRPDCLPQIASLAIATGNGLVLKGGTESKHTNRCLYKIVQESLALHECANAVQLIESRENISNLIKNAHEGIDLIIPRGSSDMIRSIQNLASGSSVPVLGHSEGICHVYVDRDCSVEMAQKIVRDSKCNYPAACNAMETLLIHKDLLHTSVFKEINNILQIEGVKIHLGPELSSRLLFPPSHAVSLKHEYSSLECCIEVVDNVDAAIRHIHKYGSAHTDTIVTSNDETAEKFLSAVDSACVFHNTSTRFADGQRMGLGAEVGISTTRIHARGPVGAEGLLSYKWMVKGDGHVVQDFTADGPRSFDFKELPINS